MYEDESLLALMRMNSKDVPEADRARYTQIYNIIDQPSPLLSEQGLRGHAQALQHARTDLLAMAERWRSEDNVSPIVAELIRRGAEDTDANEE